MEDYDEGWDDEGDDLALEPKISEGSLIKTKDYAVWSSNEIEVRQNKIIAEAMELLGLSEDDAITALKHFNWNSEKLQERWFENEAKTRDT